MKRFYVLAVLFFSASFALGQGLQKGQLEGRAVLQDGSTIPGVTVNISSPALQGTRSQTTGPNGDFIFKFLPVGVYTVTFELSGMKTVVQTVTVSLGGTARTEATMEVSAAQETVTVTDQGTAVEKATVHSSTFAAETIQDLPIARTLGAVSSLAPGLTTGSTTTPNAGQVKISGAFAYDNLFLVDGVDVNDNLFGTPTDTLVIEEAVEETQVMTSGISAEYGRFSGGVVNAITKSGGNEYHGSLRVDLTNDDWRDENPFEVENDIVHPDTINSVYSGTLGGKIVADRLWFFLGGRYFNTESQGTLIVSENSFTSTEEQLRYEAKLTGNIAQGHSLQVAYTRADRETFRRTFDFTAEDAGLITPKFPTDLFVANYNGVITSNLFASLQYSQKTFKFENFGGTSTDIHDSPFFSLTLSPFAHYGQPYFDANDPENRDNDQWAGSLSYYLSTANLGTHDLKVGGEWFTSISKGGNSQSPTNFVFDTDYLVNDDGDPVFDANGRLIPTFTTEGSFLEEWLAVRGAESNIATKSVFFNDVWHVSKHLTASLGLRYEKVDGEGPSGATIADEDSLVPRLGISYDVLGDGRFVLSGNYAQYAGRFQDNQFNNGTNVGNPDLFYYIYTGPGGQGYDFAPGFDLANYFPIVGNFPTANVIFDRNLSSPLTTEWTLSVGGRVTRNSSAAVTYVNREINDFFESFTSLDNGTTTILRDGEPFLELTNVFYKNTNLVERKYEAVQFQGGWKITPRLLTQLGYTYQIKNEGNSEGEAANQPGVTSVIGDFVEIYAPERNFPFGRLNGYQKHKLRFLTSWGVPTPIGTFTLGGIYNYDSGNAYNLVQASQDFTDIQLARDPGYPDLPPNQDVFYGSRGAQVFPDRQSLDLALQYEIPIWKSLSPWIKFQVFNVTGEEDLIAHNTSIFGCTAVRAPGNDDPRTGCAAAPRDENGLPTTYRRSINFGKARSAGDYQRATEYTITGGIRF